MKQILIALTLLLATTQLYAQDMVIGEVNKSNFKGIYKSGEMGETLLIPYFTKEKIENKNFFIKRINALNLIDEETMALELPESYDLQTMSFNVGVYTLLFKDKGKNDNILITARDNSVIERKTIKGSGTWKIVTTMNPESFILANVQKNGAYTLEMFSTDMESKWKKTFAPEKASWDVVSLGALMDKIVITRRILSDKGNYSYYIHTIQSENGEHSIVNDLKVGDFQGYPTFITSSQGLTYIGGYYYKDATIKGNPVGFFFGTLSPDGMIEQATKIPYSQILESVNKELGEKLTDKNNGIIFTMGGMSMSDPTFTIAGQIFSRADNTSGGGVFRAKDIIVLKLNAEQEFKEAHAIKIPEKEAQINGNIASINDIDLAYWMSQNDFLQLKHITQTQGAAKVAYTKAIGNEPLKLCYKPIVSNKKDSIPEYCVEASRDIDNKAKGQTYAFNSPFEFVTPTGGIMYDPMNEESLRAYEINNNVLMIWGIGLPEIEEQEMNMAEEEQPDENEPEEAPEINMNNVAPNDK